MPAVVDIVFPFQRRFDSTCKSVLAGRYPGGNSVVGIATHYGLDGKRIESL